MSKISLDDLQKIIVGATDGPFTVGNLLTLNGEEYPGLGNWWLQIRSGADGENVVARVYGDDRDTINNNAQFIAASRQALPAALRVIALAKEALWSCGYNHEGEKTLSLVDVDKALSAIAAFEDEVTG